MKLPMPFFQLPNAQNSCRRRFQLGLLKQLLTTKQIIEGAQYVSVWFQQHRAFLRHSGGDIVKGARAVGSVLLKVQKAEPEIEALSSLVFPQAVELERGAFALLEKAAQAVNEAGDAASVNGINLALDAQFIIDLKALIQAVEQYAKAAGIPKSAGK